MVLLDSKQGLWFWELFGVWVIDLVWVELVAIFLLDEATLVTEPLLGQVLTAVVAHFFLG